MRKLPSVLAISAAVHAVGLTFASAYLHDPPSPGLTAPADDEPIVVEVLPPPPPPPPLAAAAPPVDVVLLDEPQPRAAVAPLAAPRIAATRRATVMAPETAAPTAAPVATEGPRSPYMDMRRPGTPRIALPTYEWTPDTPAEPPPPAEPAPSGKLGDAANGGKKSDQGVFTARVDADGNVKLKDTKNLRIKIAIPTPKMLGRILADWYEMPDKPMGGLPPDHPPVEVVMGNGDVVYVSPEDGPGGAVAPGAEVSGQRKDHGDVASIPILSGGFDVSDAFMRRHGQDPYAAKKLAFLDATRDERVQIGVKHRSEQLAAAPKIMQANLARLWATTADPAARREALFELWDEIEESGSAEMIAASVQVRAMLIGWIRARLPAGTPDAYSAAELAALNRRRSSHAEFAPY